MPKPEVVEGEPIAPLEHESPLMMMRDNDATLPERVSWKLTHRRKSPLHLRLGPVPLRGVLLINGDYDRVLERGGTADLVLDEERLNRGNNTIDFAPLDPPEPESTIARLASNLASLLEVRECANEITAKADWAFAKWEMPHETLFDPVAKARLGEQTGPVWWQTTFTLDETPSRPLLLDPGGMTKGQAYVNGYNLGRYFAATADGTPVPPEGPLWIPTPWLRVGDNELVLFDEHGGNPSKVRIQSENGARPIVASLAGELVEA
jgi:hypothetical protein